MQLHVIETGLFKLDGGAMYGVVPKTIWNRQNPADENNLCNWAMRCLLIEDGERLILIDTGIGNKQSEKFFGFYYLSETCPLETALKQKGYGMDEVTDVLLTHLHFDHSGGAVEWNDDKSGYRPAFRNATYWSHAGHWAHACNPNLREKPSFLKENFIPLQEAGQLRFVESGSEFGPDIQIRIVNGHTVSMMCPLIRYKAETLLYCADLIPSASHVPVNYVMGYDIEPLKTMQEKSALLAEAQSDNWLLFYEHDPRIPASRVLLNEKGSFQSGMAAESSDILLR